MRNAQLTPATTFLRFTIASAAHSAWGPVAASGTPAGADGVTYLVEASAGMGSEGMGSEDASSEGEAAANVRLASCGFDI